MNKGTQLLCVDVQSCVCLYIADGIRMDQRQGFIERGGGGTGIFTPRKSSPSSRFEEIYSYVQ